jgi:hypothetical protein
MAKTDNRKDNEWLELCEWIEVNIFNYDTTKGQRLQKKACLILKGLRKGQNVANNKCQMYGNYPDNIILMTFKANRTQILNAIKNKNFDDESNKMSYICAIVRGKLNDMYTRYLNAQKTQEKVETVDTSIVEHEGAEYKSNNTERKTNKRLEGLW